MVFGIPMYRDDATMLNYCLMPETKKNKILSITASIFSIFFPLGEDRWGRIPNLINKVKA